MSELIGDFYAPGYFVHASTNNVKINEASIEVLSLAFIIFSQFLHIVSIDLFYYTFRRHYFLKLL